MREIFEIFEYFSRKYTLRNLEQLLSKSKNRILFLSFVNDLFYAFHTLEFFKQDMLIIKVSNETITGTYQKNHLLCHD